VCCFTPDRQKVKKDTKVGMRAYFADGQAVEAAPGDTGREKSRGDSRRCGLLPVPRLAPGR